MYQSRVLSSLILSLVIGTPACGAKFVSLGDEDAGTAHRGVDGTGGSSLLGAGGSSVIVGGTGDCVCTGEAPKMVDYVCSDGSIGGPVCERDVVDACNWVIRDCPVTPGAGGGAGAGGTAAGVGGAGPNPNLGGAAANLGGADRGMGGFAGGGAAAGSNGIAGGGAAAGAGGYNCVCTADPSTNLNHVCPDGSVVGPVCGRGEVDECTWLVGACPPTPGVGGAGAGGSPNAGGAAPIGGSSSSGITCEYNGVVYRGGQEFPDTDGCNSCHCTAEGLVGCTLVYCVSSCEYYGVVYAVGQSFPAIDCGVCQCSHWGVQCTDNIDCVDAG